MVGGDIRAFLISLAGFNVVFFSGLGFFHYLSRTYWPLIIIYQAIFVPLVILLVYRNYGEKFNLNSLAKFIFRFNLMNILHVIALVLFLGIVLSPILLIDSGILTLLILIVGGISFVGFNVYSSRYYFRFEMYTFKSLYKNVELGNIITRNKLFEDLSGKGRYEFIISTRLPTSNAVILYSFLTGFYFFMMAGPNIEYSLFELIFYNEDTIDLVILNMIASFSTVYYCKKIYRYSEKLDEVLKVG